MDIKFSGSDAGGFQFDPNAAPKPKRERKPRKSIGSKGGRIAVNTLVTPLVGEVFFYCYARNHCRRFHITDDFSVPEYMVRKLRIIDTNLSQRVLAALPYSSLM